MAIVALTEGRTMVIARPSDSGDDRSLLAVYPLATTALTGRVVRDRDGGSQVCR